MRAVRGDVQGDRVHGRCGAGAARCAPTRIGLAALGYLVGLLRLTGSLLEWCPDALLFVFCDRLLARAVRFGGWGCLAGPLPGGRGSVWRIWPLACARGWVFLMPAGYQPLGVAGQRVIGAINRKPIPRCCRETLPDRSALVERTEQRISLV